MGMYTEIRTNVILRPDTPNEVLDTIMAMQSRDFEFGVPGKIDHPFFRCHRWSVIFTMGSAYFPEEPWSELSLTSDGWKLSSVANLKNYDGEIAKFADWIKQYALPQKEPIVTSEYEESEGSLVRYYADGRIENDPPRKYVYD